MPTQAALSIQNLNQTFAGDRKVLQNVQMQLQEGSFLSLLGPSGCGKSTLLRLVAGLDQPTSGQIVFSLKNPRKSFVFQEAQLLDWRTVEENILLPFELQNSKLTLAEKKSRVTEVLKQVQLSDAQNLFPHQLSGGMKMRVSLARALVTRPQVLLLDEPFSALDEDTRFAMQDLLLQIWQEEKMTVLFVTHSLAEALYLSERVIRWDKSAATLFDKPIHFSQPRTRDLRTSEEFNQLLIASQAANRGAHA